jgi:hypothetical protein
MQRSVCASVLGALGVALGAGRIPNARLSDSVRRRGGSVYKVAMASSHPCCNGPYSGSGGVDECGCADVQMRRCTGVQNRRAGGRPSLCVPNRAGVVGAERIQFV